MKPTIAIILTGGSIDKEYDSLDRAFTIGNSAVKRVLGYVNPNINTEIISLLQKVSVDISEEDKILIKNAVSETKTDKVIVTYGTDAMTEIGEVLKEIKNKTIIVTGSLKSQLIKETDAEFNLGFAIASVQTMPHGVYIAMSGRIYNWDSCRKDITTGQFVENVL